ncbi:pectate lyase [Niabella terrae]
MQIMKHWIRLFVAGQLLLGCSPPPQATLSGAQRPLAFPGAEGFGRYTTGGREGQVLLVTNLNDDGPGSLRKAAVARYKRTIVFKVSGTIHLKSRLYIKGDVTIAGQTAPGGGICLADYPVSLSGDNIIIRYLRFRMGDRFQNQGKTDGGGGDDAFGASGKKHIIIDHCSISWSTDEVCSVYKGDSTTLQWNLISEPLNYSYHFESGDQDFEHHGYGGIWGGRHFSAHHNLLAHCNSRTPRFNGVRLGADTERADFRNNVIYNWGHNNVYGGEGGSYNLVNNYYKYGPETKKSVRNRIVNPTYTKNPDHPYGRFYVQGNYVDGAPDVSRNNRLGIQLDKSRPGTDLALAVSAQPFAAEAIPEQTAQEAYSLVLRYAGAVLPQRDSLDERIIGEVQQRKGRFIDVQGGHPHGTPYAQTVNAWPRLASAAPAPDSDQDGMPDDWEKTRGLDPHSDKDVTLYTLDRNYTNIEIYINSLVAQFGSASTR